MNILFFTYDFPYPTNSGGKTRAYNLIKFAKKNANITLFSFIRDAISEEYIHVIKKLGVKNIKLFPRRKLLDVRNLQYFLKGNSLFYSLYYDSYVANQLFTTVKAEQIQLIHFESFYTACYINEIFKKMSVKQVYGSENIEYRLFEDQAKFDESVIKKVLFKSQVERLKREEISFYKTADSILTVTASEKDVVESFTNNPCFVIPNGVDIQLFLAKEKQPDSSILLFVGNFTYFPNIDAMRFFFSHIFSQLPKNVQLIIVGKNASRLDFLQGEERISILDYIEDIREVYRKASVFVSPIRVGGGTNFKVLEAMACGVPVVALANRVRDFNFTDGKELLIARTADEFIRKLTKLLSDYDLRKQLAKNARIAVEKYYNWENIGEKLYNVWRQTMDERN